MIVCRVKRVPLPAELVEHFGHMQCSCDMGIFPEVKSAVDPNTLFLDPDLIFCINVVPYANPRDPNISVAHGYIINFEKGGNIFLVLSKKLSLEKNVF